MALRSQRKQMYQGLRVASKEELTGRIYKCFECT